MIGLNTFMNNPGEIGLFTSRDRFKGEAVAHEDVVGYLKWATTKALELDRRVGWVGAHRVKDANNKIRSFHLI